MNTKLGAVPTSVIFTSSYAAGLCICKSKPETAFYIILFSLVLFFVFVAKALISIIFGTARKRHRFSAILLVGVFLFGCFRVMFWKNETLSFAKTIEGKTLVFTGEIASEPQKDRYGYTAAQVIVYDYFTNGTRKSINDRFYLTYKEKENAPLSFGDKIKFSAIINANEKHSQNYKNINCVLPLRAEFYLKCGRADITKSPTKMLRYCGIFLKSKITEAADKVFCYSPKSRAVVKAIITGDKTDFSDSLYSDFASAGFLHIAAVSGMHVSILFAAFLNLLAAMRIKRKAAVLFCPVILIMFCSVAAFTPSVLRASVMTTLAVMSTLFSREYNSVSALFISALIILLVYPFALFSPGFLLSFGATLGICIMFKPFMNLKITKNVPVPLRFVASSFCTSLSAFFGITIFEIYYFGTINLTSLITNLWIVPSVNYLFCLGLLSCCFYYFLPAISFKILRYLTEPFIFLAVKTSDIFSKAGNISIKVSFMPASFCALYVAAVVILIYILKCRR